jgi:all-trans-8'-apo-beta-carotenal 15,15'-oxygenase
MSTERLIQYYNKSISGVHADSQSYLKVSEGEIPKKLEGTLFRNGPGKFGFENDCYAHPFDGDGLLSSFKFKNGTVFFQNQFVKTEEFTEESLENKRLYRTFGTNLKGGISKNLFKLKFKNSSNTNIVYHGGKLLSLWEGGWPHRIDRENLNTVGKYGFEGGLKNKFNFIDRAVNPELPFSAHPKLDPASQNLYNIGTSYGLKNKLLFYEIDQKGRLSKTGFIDLPELNFVHDFCITESRKIIVHLSPVSFNITSMLLGKESPAAGLRSKKNSPAQILIVDMDFKEDRLETKDYKTFQTPSHFIFHHVNAFETKDSFELFSLAMDEAPSISHFQETLSGKNLSYPVTFLLRHSVSKRTGSVVCEKLPASRIELPRVDPTEQGQSHSCFYCVATDKEKNYPFMTQIQKIDKLGSKIASYQYDRGLVGEPVKIKGHKYVMSLCYNGEKNESELLILDSESLELTAAIEVPSTMTIGFHGNWYSQKELEL